MGQLIPKRDAQRGTADATRPGSCQLDPPLALVVTRKSSPGPAVLDWPTPRQALTETQVMAFSSGLPALEATGAWVVQLAPVSTEMVVTIPEESWPTATQSTAASQRTAVSEPTPLASDVTSDSLVQIHPVPEMKYPSDTTPCPERSEPTATQRTLVGHEIALS